MDAEKRLDIIDSRLEHLAIKVVELRIGMKDEFAEMRMLLRTINAKLDRILVKIDDHEHRLTTAGL